MKLRPITVTIQHVPQLVPADRDAFRLCWHGTNGSDVFELLLTSEPATSAIANMVRRVNEMQDEKAREMGWPVSEGAP